MKIAVIGNEGHKLELLSKGKADELDLTWFSKAKELSSSLEADAVIHLLFEEEKGQEFILKDFLPRPIIVNSVCRTLKEINYPFIRINGWPTFLQREVVELSCNEQEKKNVAEEIFSLVNKKIIWTPDLPGFISARVISMIINEAYLALDEKVSTKEDIDKAMKLGTNYPYGPFEWSQLIGLRNIKNLLQALTPINKYYNPSDIFQRETI